MHFTTTRKLSFVLFTITVFTGPSGRAEPKPTTIDQLPANLARDDAEATPDWLIDGTPYRANVFRTEQPDEIALDNGLIRRTFRLAPNVATVGFDNLTTGQALIRGVKPEASVTIDGVRYDVGGLRGQPNYAYLTADWIEQLTADPAAFQFVGFAVGEPQERMAWKRVRHHAPDAKWPPQGVHLRLDFEMPTLSGVMSGEGLLPSDLGREQLIEDAFEELDNAWTIHASKSHPRCSFENEGKPGEICTPTNTAVFAERQLPPGTDLVEATIDTGTDQSASWGPGISLVWKDRTIKFHLRPGGNTYDSAPMFGLWDGSRENAALGGRQQLDVSKPWTLRMRRHESTLFFEARRQGGSWRSLGSVGLPPDIGDPLAARVGKMNMQGGSGDHKELGELIRCRVIDFAAYGEMDEETARAADTETDAASKVRASVHYELYDGVPVLSKWLTVRNPTSHTLTVDRFTSELLAVVEHANWVEKREGVALPRPESLHVETDFAFGGFNYLNANRHIVHWRSDPQYSTQVNYLRQQPCLLVVEPTYGPAQEVESNGSFESCRAFELAYDSTDRERRGLALRHMYRTIAPWVTENPMMMHMRTANIAAVRGAIDQCAEVGFEMLILSFGSGFNIENESPDYLQQWKEVSEYARSKGIEIGGYSLLSSRQIGGGNAIVSPPGERPTHGNCPALTSEWGQEYFRKLYAFFPATGFSLLEHDGSYPGDVDVTPRPPLQKGEQDSRWVQWRIISDFYRWCRGNGIYLNVPDYYYLAGSNKCGMGYREVNWSLPRAQQVIHTRQNIYDGTWTKTPSMGWMFVPLTQYHGGGAAATIEPLDQHRDHYERMISSNLALGVQACYRGPRLYDTQATQKMVKQQVDWYKEYRNILESDVIHGRRADGRDLDWMLHVNPKLPTKGMLIVFNPLDQPASKNLCVNLYFTGLTKSADIRTQLGSLGSLPLARDYTVLIPVDVPANGISWYAIDEAGGETQ